MLRIVPYLLVIVIGLSLLACDAIADPPTPMPAPSPESPTTALPNPTLPQPSPSPTPRLLPTPQSIPTPPPTPEPPPTPAAPRSPGTSQGLLVNSSDLPEIVARSSVIVVGTIDDGRPREESIPSGVSTQRSLVRVYDVHVERYLKGEGDEVLSVIQYDGIEHIDPLDGVIRQSRYPSSEILPTRGDRYILFLIEHEHATGLWQLPARPYKFRIWFGRAVVESPAGDVIKLFPQTPEDEFVSQIRTLVASP